MTAGADVIRGKSPIQNCGRYGPLATSGILDPLHDRFASRHHQPPARITRTMLGVDAALQRTDLPAEPLQPGDQRMQRLPHRLG